MNRKKTKYERCYCRRMPSGKYAWPEAATRQWLWPISGALSNSSECRTKQWNEQEQQKSCRICWLSASIDSPGRFSRQHRARSINIYLSLFVVAPAQQTAQLSGVYAMHVLHNAYPRTRMLISHRRCIHMHPVGRFAICKSTALHSPWQSNLFYETHSPFDRIHKKKMAI